LGLFSFAFSQDNPSRPFVQHLASWDGSDSGTAFKEPSGIAVDPQGNLFVADAGNHRVVKLDAQGRVVQTIGGFGWSKEQFNRPSDVSARNGLDCFVADYNNGRIERFDKDLHWLSSLTSLPQWPENFQFGFPLDVDLSSQGELFCLDGENQRVIKFDASGEPQLGFGDLNIGEGRLVDPRRILVSDPSNVYVTDGNPARVVVFDGYGNLRNSFGQGILENPVGMASVSRELLLVADASLRRVMVFRNPGVLIGSFGAPEAYGGFGEPLDAACWGRRVYVLDRKNNRIDVFQWIDVQDQLSP
jgi:DNA-binding beta-propeller fold protein YncE